MGILDYFRNWRAHQRESYEARVKFLQEVEDFATESKIYVPKNATVHIEAAKYRHAWKRAVTLEILYGAMKLHEKSKWTKDAQDVLAKKYYKVAPETLYGKPKLEISQKAFKKLYKFELNLLLPDDKPKVGKELACIYLGTDTNTGKKYIGQTVNEPEARYKQHKDNRTGPYKSGKKYVNWKVIEESVSLDELDFWESYWIGYFDTYENGYNDNRGKCEEAYIKGRDRMHSNKLPME